MDRSTPSTRIGDAERAEAQRALQDHLNAGRSTLDACRSPSSWSDSPGVADAVTAAEIAALFADLPAPHPTLPELPRARTRRNLVIVGAVAVLALVGSLGFVIGRAQTAPSPSSVAGAAPTPSASPATEPSASLTESAAPLPDSATVRRSTGPGLVTLRPSCGVDLDDLTSPTWNAVPGAVAVTSGSPPTHRRARGDRRCDQDCAPQRRLRVARSADGGDIATSPDLRRGAVQVRP